MSTAVENAVSLSDDLNNLGYGKEKGNEGDIKQEYATNKICFKAIDIVIRSRQRSWKFNNQDKLSIDKNHSF